MLLKVKSVDLRRDIYINTDFIAWIVPMETHQDVNMSDGTCLGVVMPEEIFMEELWIGKNELQS